MRKHHLASFSILGTAIGALLATAQAEELDEATRLSTPNSTVRVGAGNLDVDNQRFGQYNGMREDGIYGLLDLDFVERDDDSGTWYLANARNLGLENREANLEVRRQGSWGVAASYSELPRYNPYEMNTALGGIGGNNLAIGGAGTARLLQLDTLREILALTADRRFSQNLSLQVNFRNDNKSGARQFGRGTPGAMEFLAEPIDYTMQQLEATAVYTGDQLQLAGGYYATEFDNENTALNIAGGAPALSTGAGAFTPIALPPDNQSHQLYLSGGYSFSPTTRASFKAAYARLEQEDDFILASPTGRTDLGGRVDVTNVYASLAMQPFTRLSVVSQFRYEDRDDKTPIARYFTGATPTSTFDGDNEPRSIETTYGKVEATYRLPLDFQLTGGAAYEIRERNVSPVRVVSARDETRELSYRAELRRTLSATLTGALSLVHAEREGSPFLLTVLNNGAPGSNRVAPIHLADRDRNQARLMLDWSPVEPLSFQVQADYGEDAYKGMFLGVDEGRAERYALDVNYAFQNGFVATAWASKSTTRAQQRSQVNAPTGQVWEADLRNHDDAYGLELRARAFERLNLGADLLYAEYVDEYRQRAITGTPIASLPDIHNRQSRLDLFASFELTANAGLRMDVIHERWRTDDWTWSTWTYIDGTRLLQDPNQRVTFVGLSAYLNTW